MKGPRVLALLALVTAAAMGVARPAAAVDVNGSAEVLSGDTLKIAGRTIALYGAVAPQMEQRCFDNALPWWCGKYAQERLERIVGHAEVHCTDKGRNARGTMLGLCKAGSVDLAESQIRNGLAIADGPRGVTYLDAERSARQGQTGIWRGNPNGTFTQ